MMPMMMMHFISGKNNLNPVNMNINMQQKISPVCSSLKKGKYNEKLMDDNACDSV